ncbi:hypothetical protein DMENIID0001_042950 [Sergentomyia squamirostris]
MRKPYFKWPQVSSIYESFSPIFHLISLCLPITLPTTRHTTRSRPTVIQIVQFSVNILVLVYMYVMTTIGGIQFTQLNSDSEIMMTGMKMMSAFGVFYILSIYIVFRLLQKKIRSFIDRLDELDRKIHILSGDFNYTEEFQFFLILTTSMIIGCFTVAIIQIIVIDIDSFLLRIFITIFTYAINNSGVGLILLMTLFIIGIRTRFMSINATIANLLTNPKSSNGEIDRVITQLAKYHSELIDLVEDINRTLIAYITVDLMGIFLFNLMNSLAFFRLTVLNDTHGWTMRIVNILWGLYQANCSLLAIGFAHSMRKQCKLTGKVIHKVLNGEQSVEKAIVFKSHVITLQESKKYEEA